MKLKFTVIERLIITSSLDVYKINSNSESRELDKIFEQVEFSDEEREKYEIKFHDNGHIGFKKELSTEEKEIELSKHIVENFYNKYFNDARNYISFLIFEKLFSAIKDDIDKDCDDFDSKYDVIEFKTIGNIDNSKIVMLQDILGMGSEKWIELFSEKQVLSVDDLKTIVEYFSYIEISDEEAEKYNLKYIDETLDDGTIIKKPVSDDDETLKVRYAPKGLSKKISDIIYKTGIERRVLKAITDLNLINEE